MNCYFDVENNSKFTRFKCHGLSCVGRNAGMVIFIHHNECYQIQRYTPNPTNFTELKIA